MILIYSNSTIFDFGFVEPRVFPNTRYGHKMGTFDIVLCNKQDPATDNDQSHSQRPSPDVETAPLGPGNAERAEAQLFIFISG
jgi:hypothetical protein